jgi:oligopeptidase B
MPWQGKDHYIDFKEDAYTCGIGINPDFDTDVLRCSFTSMTTPNTTYDYNMTTKNLTLLKQQEVVGKFNKDEYTSERLMVKARDGKEVPVSLVYKKGYAKDGNRPLLLYAYGSYGNSMDPYFSSSMLSLLDRGFAYAIAHIRGGQEMGRKWYEDGKFFNKKNTFTDYIDVAKYLIDKKYTSKDKLFAEGGSAGGLLMGAVVNMAPELFKGVIAQVPFVDVVSTMLDESIPLTTGEYDEWGNPNQKEYYEYMKSYSPYDNVEKKAYPAILVTTGYWDSQVQYWEPAKWVAKLREYKTDKNPLLLYSNMDTGHSGASGRFEAYKEIAREFAFMLDLAGLIPPDAMAKEAKK